MSQLLTATEAAKRLGVDPSTVRRYAASGQLDHQRTAGGHLRIQGSAVEQLLSKALRGGSATWTGRR